MGQGPLKRTLNGSPNRFESISGVQTRVAKAAQILVVNKSFGIIVTVSILPVFNGPNAANLGEDNKFCEKIQQLDILDNLPILCR